METPRPSPEGAPPRSRHRARWGRRGLEWSGLQSDGLLVGNSLHRPGFTSGHWPQFACL